VCARHRLQICCSTRDNEKDLIDFCGQFAGVIVAVFFEELADGKCASSLRSKMKQSMVPARFAKEFGVAAHTGRGRPSGSLAEVEKKVTGRKIREVLKAQT